MDPEHPLAQKLFDSVAAGECRRQASVGGSALGEKVYDPEAGRVIRQLRDGTLDHVALTRRGGAANPETGFLSAVLKSVDWARIEEPEGHRPEGDLAKALAAMEERLARLEAQPMPGATLPVRSELSSASEAIKAGDRERAKSLFWSGR